MVRPPNSLRKLTESERIAWMEELHRYYNRPLGNHTVEEFEVAKNLLNIGVSKKNVTPRAKKAWVKERRAVKNHLLNYEDPLSGAKGFIDITLAKRLRVIRKDITSRQFINNVINPLIEEMNGHRLRAHTKPARRDRKGGRPVTLFVTKAFRSKAYYSRKKGTFDINKEPTNAAKWLTGWLDDETTFFDSKSRTKGRVTDLMKKSQMFTQEQCNNLTLVRVWAQKYLIPKWQGWTLQHADVIERN